MAESDFLGKLRMANIFPTQGGQPFGMPDMNSGNSDINPSKIFAMIQQGKDLDQMRNLNLDNEMRRRTRQEERYKSGNLNNIVQSSMSPNQGKNVVVREDPNKITPYQRESLDIQRERLGQTGNLGQERIDTTRRGQDISSGRLNLAERVQDERQPNALELIGARADATSGQIDQRAGHTANQIDQRGAITDRQIDTRAQNSRDLQASGAANTSNQIDQREQNLRGRPITASQTGNAQTNAIRELVLTRPDLAQYITETPDGQITIKPDTPMGALADINKMVYGKRDVNTSADILLSSSGSKTNTGKPTPADLIKKYGG